MITTHIVGRHLAVAAALSGPALVGLVVPAAAADVDLPGDHAVCGVPAGSTVSQYVNRLDFGGRELPEGSTIGQRINRLDFGCARPA